MTSYLPFYLCQSHYFVPVPFAQFSDFLPHKIQCLNGNDFETINPISILFQNLLTYFNHIFQKCKVPFYDMRTLVFCH